MSLMDLFSDKNEQKAADALKAGFQTGKTDAYGEIDKGVAGANTDYAAALGLYQPLADTYGKGSSMYANGLGLNGADGNAAAMSAYQTGPGYQFSVDQALQAVERRAGAQGQLGSGQTGIDTINTAYGLANQDYGNWLERLSGYDGKAEHSTHDISDAELMAIIHDTAAAAGLAVSEMTDDPEQEVRH